MTKISELLVNNVKVSLFIDIDFASQSTVDKPHRADLERNHSMSDDDIDRQNAAAGR